MITESKTLYERLAEKYGLTLDQAREVIYFFWRTGVLEAITEYRNPEVYIRGLGSFHIKGYALKYKIPQFQGHIDSLQEPEQWKIDNVERMRELQKMIFKIKEEKKEFDARNIREQKKDLGGVEEQNIQAGTC